MAQRQVAIFLGGTQGSGKSTAADFIEGQLFKVGWAVVREKFAEPVYKIAQQIESVMAEYSGQEPKEKNGPLLQIVGTDIGRNLFGKDIWVNHMKNRIEMFSKAFVGFPKVKICVIVEDTRMENEFCLQDQLAGFETVSIYFDAEEEIRKSRTNSWRSRTDHESEQVSSFRDLFKFTVDTNGTVEDKNFLLYQILNRLEMFPTAEERLQTLVDDFNVGLTEWAAVTSYGANFSWQYDQQGVKSLKVRDVAPIDKLPDDSMADKLTKMEQKMTETFDIIGQIDFKEVVGGTDRAGAPEVHTGIDEKNSDSN